MTEPQTAPYSTLGPNRMVPLTTFGRPTADSPPADEIPPDREPPPEKEHVFGLCWCGVEHKLEDIPDYLMPATQDEIVDKYDPTKAGSSPYDDPEFQKDLEEGIAAQIEGWQRDWSIRVNALMVALTLSRPEAMLYLLLMQMGTLRGMASGFQHMWNAEPAQRRRAMQDALLEAQLKDRGFELEKQEDPGVPISEAAKAAAAKGWKIR